MGKECVICKREIGDLEKSTYGGNDDGKFGQICEDCYDRIEHVEGREKAWQRYQEQGDYISKYGGPRSDPEEEKENDRLKRQAYEKEKADEDDSIDK